MWEPMALALLRDLQEETKELFARPTISCCHHGLQSTHLQGPAFPCRFHDNACSARIIGIREMIGNDGLPDCPQKLSVTGRKTEAKDQ